MNFQHFHTTWLDQLEHLVHQLRSQSGSPTCPELVGRVVAHYTEYQRVKSEASHADDGAGALFLLSSPWATSLERSLSWVGGWRPTTAFHVMYTESSLHFETRVADILQGVCVGGLGDLSPAQFRRVSELQCETVGRENEIADELAQWQDDAIGIIVGMHGGEDEAAVEGKIERLGVILESADQLRLRTMTSLVDLLTPRQAAEFLVADVELQFGIRAWGIQLQISNNNYNNDNNNNNNKNNNSQLT